MGSGGGPRLLAEQSPEITAISQLLDELSLAGRMVTLAARGNPTQIAPKIIDQCADEVLALKGNHGQLPNAVAAWCVGYTPISGEASPMRTKHLQKSRVL